MMKWKKIPNTLPPYDTHILAINENGFIVQTRRFKAWDAHWTGKRADGEDGRDIIRWQYWCELPEVPKNIERSYDKKTIR